MKKLLVATSALVAAGSAAALEVTLGGEISTSVSFDGAVWAGPAIGGGADDGISLAVSGESWAGPMAPKWTCWLAICWRNRNLGLCWPGFTEHVY